MLENIKAVLFDLDGTLVDSMWMWKDIDIEYLGRYGYELPSELQKEIEGMSLSETPCTLRNGLPSRRVWKKSRAPGWIWQGINIPTKCH